MPQWLVACYAAVYVGVAQSAVTAAVEHLRARDARPSCRPCGPGSAGPRRGWRRPGWPCWRRPAGWTRPRATPETNRWVWRAKLLAGETAMDVAASMLEAAGTSATRRGHPLERLFRDARCGSLQPATSDVCADWLGVAALGDDPDARAGAAMVSCGRRAPADDGRGRGRRHRGEHGPGDRRHRDALPPRRARTTLWDRLLRRALPGRADRRAAVRQLRCADPARRGQPDATRTSPVGAPGPGWSATWPRRCRWARTRSRPRSPTPGSPRPTSGCSSSAPAPAT